MNKGVFRIGLLILLSVTLISAQTRVRQEVNFPDILEYKTLICDFHTHTVFSDGEVWPSVRAEEAWREGIDVIAITDHIEYLPHKEDINIGFNRSFEIASPHGEAMGLTVLRGGEITRGMPPGHSNAIFLEDVAKLKVENWRDAFKAAAEQNAFIFWNHPGWKGQQDDGMARWYEEHGELLEKGWLHGIEVVNEREYYPEAHRWCLENNLTMLSNSDIHAPIHMDYELHKGDHRPLTLVFATGNSPEEIKQALFDHRTVVYSGEFMVGKAKFLEPLFYNSINIRPSEVELVGEDRKYLQISNGSDMDYKLSLSSKPQNIKVPEKITLYAGKTVLFSVKATSDDMSGNQYFEISYIAENLLVEPEKGLPVKLKFKGAFKPE